MRLLRAFGVSAVLLPTALLAACTGDRAAVGPTATLSEPPSAEPSVTRSSTAAPESNHEIAPAPPADLALSNEAGAAAAAEYFIELYPYVLASGDFVNWDKMSRPECTFCVETRAYVADRLAGGGSFEGGQVEATVVAVQPADDLIGGYPVDVDIHQDVTVERASDGTVVSSSGKEILQSRVDVVRTAEGWKILAVSNRAH